jgi:hypothetical protein
MNLLQLVRTTNTRPTFRDQFSLDDYIEMMTYNNNTYPFGGLTSYGTNADPGLSASFAGYARGALKANGIVWACNLKRVQIFSEARWGFRELVEGRPGQMFHTSALDVLTEPEPGKYTPEMNARLIQDVDVAGNAYLFPRLVGRRLELRRPRPDWVKIVYGTPQMVDGDRPVGDLDLTPIALAYFPDGKFDQEPSVMVDYDSAVHWKPYPDPADPYRGMSWITPILREIQSDNAATTHKKKYWENAATPNMMVKLDISDTIKFQEWVERFNEQHSGTANAYKTLFLGAGADPTIIGGNMQQMDFANVSGVSENRIVMAAGLTATLLGTTEGLKGSSLNAGNYNSSRRSTADTTLANLFRTAASALQNVVDVPDNAEVWFHAEDVPFLQEDQADAAKIRKEDATTIEALIRGGFTPDSSVQAVTSGRFELLEHTGLVSVQLQPPGTGDEPSPIAEGV